jgi:ParB/RepB/Spo0J family partition protein
MDYTLLPLASITPSLTNAERAARYKPNSMAELAANIKTTGVRQPILVRRLPANRLADTFDTANANGAAQRPEYELIAGQRRWQASQMADLRTIPAMVATDMDDDADALRFQLVENLQREDQDPLDEAQGYQRLIDLTGAAKEDIGEQINKSRRYVYDRLSLLKLCPAARQAMATEGLDVSHALLIAKVPHDELQAKAIAYATAKNADTQSPPSVRQLQVWLRQNVMLDLKHATFKIADKTLCDSAGACTACPRRTGYAPDLFAHVQDADVCTDPVCYQHKAGLHHTQLKAIAEAKGYTLINGKEAKHIVGPGAPDDKPLQGYSRLDQVREDIDGRTLRKLLGKQGIADCQPALIEHPGTRTLIEAVPTTQAEAMLVELGLLKPAPVAKSKSKASPEQQAKTDASNKIDTIKRTKVAIVAALSQVTYMPDDWQCESVLRWMAYNRLDNLAYSDLGHASTLVGMHPNSDYFADIADHIAKMTVEQLPDAILKLVMLDMIPSSPYESDEDDPIAAAMRKDLLQLVDISQADIAAAAKSPLPPTPLAQPHVAPATGKKTKPAAPPKAKLSAQDAQLGIAAAMQADEGAAALAAAQDTRADPLGQAATTGPQGDAQGMPGAGFAIGQTVKVTATTDTLRVVAHKYIGKTGTITAQIGDAWDVAFKGRYGGLCSFAASELGAV